MGLIVQGWQGDMRNYRCCGLIGGGALFALGPAQMNATPIFTHQVNLSPTHSAHGPMVRADGPDGSPMQGPHNETTSSNWLGYGLHLLHWTRCTS
jgi:hypothetical protein